ncbi:MAG: DNA polymerase III subunit delta [Anaeroplasma sp.]|nr:DNA polymerase III subunit delta [Anaeroplasma sp.]
MSYNYIISAEEKEEAKEKIEEIRKSIKLDFDYSEYDLEEDGLYPIIDELTTISLFDNPKFIVINSSENIIKANDKAFVELLTAMNSQENDNVLVFIFLNGFDQKNERLSRIKRYSSFIEINLKNMPLDEYARNVFSKDGYQIDEHTISLLVLYTASLASLKQAINILECYKYQEKIITDDDVKKLVVPPLEDNVYNLIDSVIQKDKARIFSILADFKKENIQYSFLVSLLINKFQEMYNVNILAKSGITQADIQDLFNVSSGKAYYMLKNAKAVDIYEIKKNLSMLNDLDYQIKTGKVDQNIGLELYFLKL